MAPIVARRPKLRVILRAGRPGVGKTTIVNRVHEHYSKNGFKIEGLTSREVREDGARTGFMITDLSSGREGWLAKKNLTAGPRVGSYVVVSDDLEKIGVAALERSMKGAADLVIVDKIGPMEITSHSFRNSISRV